MKGKKILSMLLAACMTISTAALFHSSADAAAVKTRVSVHDPSVFKDTNGTYYVFGSHIDAAKSGDLQNWRVFTNGYTAQNNVIFGDLSHNLKKAFDWAGENLEDCDITKPNSSGFAVWAPDVIYNPDYINKDGSRGAYMMYFCTTSTWIRSVLCFAVSQNPEGPYEFVDTLIYSGFTPIDSYATSSTKNVNRKYTSTNVDELIAAGEVTYNSQWFSGNNFNNDLFPNAIDPTIYYGTDGKMYMCYGSWSGGIFTLEIDPQTGKCIHPASGTTADGRMIDSYFGTKLSGSYHKSGEGPFIEYNADTGYYYLWVTYGGLTSEGGYNMRVFRSRNPDGPFYDPAGNSAVMESKTNLDSVGLKVMGNYKFSCLNKAYMAPGHNSVLRDDDGRWYLLNHTRFDDGFEFHELRVHSMYFNSEGWPVVAPYEYSGDTMASAGYETSDIAGDYEYINHGNDTSGSIRQYVSVTLQENGTISGGATGTWRQAEDSSAAELVIDGQAYSGYFMAIQEESGTEKKVMTFTAVGKNNQTVWGAKTEEWSGNERNEKLDYTNADSQLIYNAPSADAGLGNVRIGATSLLSDVTYYIENKHSGLVLDLTEGKTESGTNVQQWSRTGGSQQEWRICDLGNGYCKIVSTADETAAITVDGSGGDNGLNICVKSYTGDTNQQWKLIQDGSCFGIVSRSSGDAAGLDVYDWSTENGGNINQWEYWGGDCQLWKIEPVHPAVPDGGYILRNMNSGKWMGTDASGNVQQSPLPLTWQIERQSDGRYTLRTNGKYAAAENNSAQNGANVQLSDAAAGFALICNKDGSYGVLSTDTQGLDVFEISTEDGANICQWEYWKGDGQKWIFIPVQPEEQKVRGDVNADGHFTVADVVMLQKWLLAAGPIADAQAGDLCEDGRLNILDLCRMKRELMK